MNDAFSVYASLSKEQQDELNSIWKEKHEKELAESREWFRHRAIQDEIEQKEYEAMQKKYSAMSLEEINDEIKEICNSLEE